MYNKIKNIICHPSFLGLYLKDTTGIIIGYIFGFFLFTVLLLSAKDMHTSMLDRNLAHNIVDSFAVDESLKDTYFSNSKLYGKKKTIEYSSITIYLNDEAFVPSLADSLTLVLQEEKAYFYISGAYVGELEYKDLEINDFSFQEIIDNNYQSRMELYELMYQVLQLGDVTYRALYFFDELGSILILYFISFVISYFFAYLVNPPINRGIRFRLVGYDSISFFVVVWFAVLFSIDWLVYVAVAVPTLYAFATFTHIRRLTIKKGGNSNDN